jgi:hypothetical protein
MLKNSGTFHFPKLAALQDFPGSAVKWKDYIELDAPQILARLSGLRPEILSMKTDLNLLNFSKYAQGF